MTTPARMTPIPGKPGWWLSSVNRHQNEGRETTEVALTWMPDGDVGDGDTRTFTIPAVVPRAVILDAAQHQIDRWEREVSDE